MKNLPFVIWMLGWAYLMENMKKPANESESDKSFGAVVCLAIWLLVAAAVYEH